MLPNTIPITQPIGHNDTLDHELLHDIFVSLIKHLVNINLSNYSNQHQHDGYYNRDDLNDDLRNSQRRPYLSGLETDPCRSNFLFYSHNFALNPSTLI